MTLDVAVRNQRGEVAQGEAMVEFPGNRGNPHQGDMTVLARPWPRGRPRRRCVWPPRRRSRRAFPSKPVRIVVPFPAGGTTDILARQISTELAARWGQAVIVDNKGGASGTIGSEMLVQSAPDGHTLMLTATHHVINPGLYKKLKYDTRSDFTPIALIASVPNVLLVNPALPVRACRS
jgi:hypothetical protein